MRSRRPIAAVEFTEFIIQGIGEFQKPRRLVFKTGYNLVLGGNESGKSLLFRCIGAVIDSARFAALRGQLPIPPESEVPPRVGIIFQGQEGNYRVIRDFRTGEVAVSRLDPQTTEWKVVDRGDENWRQLWAKETGMAPSDFLRFSAVDRFSFSERSGPPRAAPAVRTEASAPVSGDEGSDRIRTLKEELTRAEEIEKIEFAIDGLHNQIFQFEEQTKGLRELERKEEELENKLEEYRNFSEVPADLDAKVEAYKQLKSLKEKEYTTLEEEKGQIEADIAEASQVKEFYKDPLFAVGVLVLLGSFVTTLVLSSFLPAPGLFIGAGLIFFTLWRFWAKREKLEALKKNRDEFDEKYQTLEKRFEIEGAVIDNLMKKTGSSTLEELREKAENHQKLIGMKKNLFEKKEALQQEINLTELEEQKKEIQSQIDEKQKRLLEIGGLSMDPNEIRREIRRLEGGGVDGESGGGGVAVDDLPAYHDSGVGTDQELGDLMARLAGVIRVGREELIQKVSADVNKTLGEVAQGRYQVRLDPGSGSGLTVTSGTNPVILTPSARETVAACLSYTIWKVIASRFSLPILLDDPFRNFDPNRFAFFLQTLKRISAKSQVIHLSFNPAVAKLADHTVRLAK